MLGRFPHGFFRQKELLPYVLTVHNLNGLVLSPACLEELEGVGGAGYSQAAVDSGGAGGSLDLTLVGGAGGNWKAGAGGVWKRV